MARTATAREDPRLLHVLPGRMRVHLAGWPPAGPCAIEARLWRVPGVHSVQTNPLTGNVLIYFDPTTTDDQTLLAVIRTLTPERLSRGASRPLSHAVAPSQRHRRSAPGGRLRLAGDPHRAGPATIRQNGRPRLLSLDLVDLIVKAVGIAVSLILADSPLGLILSGAEVVRLVMEVLGRQRARRRAEARQEHSRLTLIAAGDAGAVDMPPPSGQGRTGRHAQARRRHRMAGRPAAV